MRQNYTAVIERNVEWQGVIATEPYECGWASEAIFFVRKLASEGDLRGVGPRVQISPDGMHWCDEGTSLVLSTNEVDFCRVRHFGNWLRLSAHLPEGVSVRVLVALALKE